MVLRFTLLTLFFTTFFCTSGLAQQSENMTLLGQWDDNSLPRYSDVWGYAANGREYALLGSRNFIHILDVTDPANITELHRLNVNPNSGSSWRDIKVAGTFAYCVTEATEGIQVIDLSGLPNSAFVVYDSRAAFTTCHNIWVDESVTPNKLYAFGTNAQSSGYIVMSLADPSRPTVLASKSLSTVGSGGGYIHDGYAVNDTLYANCGNRGMYVYDVSNPGNPLELGVLANYPERGYNHSVWRTPDGKRAIMCDENQNRGVKVVNVEDPLDMEVESVFRSTVSNPSSTASIAHNPYVISNTRVVLSYYDEGIQVWDFTDPTLPTRVGYYDTTPNTTTYTNGVWGVYPYLPSGRILGSDMNNGLFVVELDQALPVVYESWTAASDGKHARLDWTVAEERDNAGWVVEHSTATSGRFAELGWVDAGQTTNTFFHEDPGPGTHYYRLRQRDVDGTEHLSEVRTVAFMGDERRAQTFPNPVRSGGAVTFRGLLEDTAWEVVDLAGRQVQSGVGRGSVLTGPGGVYFVRVGGVVVDRVVVF